MKEQVLNISISNIYDQVRQLIRGARNKVYSFANFEMVKTYWYIGKIIVEQEQEGEKRAKYGKSLVKELSVRLTKDFGKGFNERNIWYMRRFYLGFPKMNALRSELSWTHYRLLLRLDKDLARDFYLIETIKNRWSTRDLDRQVNSMLFERIAISRDQEGINALAQKGQDLIRPSDAIKDPFVLEFLDVKEDSKIQEKELEQALIDKLKMFLLELGKGFSFIARQKRITVDNDHYYVDLVFYNYILKCFVLIDLKTTKLNHQDIGQMDFYVRYFEKEEKRKGDNPTIGLVLCAEKNKTMVKYTLLEESKQLFASKYMTYLPSEEELKREIKREKDLFSNEAKVAQS
jgi:predicted nuclease of restriction endonuclease-like (RecB) superfamily